MSRLESDDMKTLIIVDGGKQKARMVAESNPQHGCIVEMGVDDWAMRNQIPPDGRGEPCRVAADIKGYFRAHKSPVKFLASSPYGRGDTDQVIEIRCRAGQGFVITVEQPEA
jgi:hypothetical protein